MKVLAMCFDCVRENKIDAMDPDIYVNYNEKMCSSVCNNGHKTYCKILNNKYELLYDSSIISYIDGYYRETVMNLFSCLESFMEYVIRILLYVKKDQKLEEIENYIKKIKSRSECREGCFFGFCKIYLDKEYFIDDKYRNLRNQVVHNGYFPNETETKKLAKYTFEFICDFYKNIKNIVGSNLINKYEISFFENERKNYKFEYQTMSITTMLSKGVDGYEFDTELKIFESRMFKFYKKEKIENIFDEEKYKVIG